MDNSTERNFWTESDRVLANALWTSTGIAGCVLNLILFVVILRNSKGFYQTLTLALAVIDFCYAFCGIFMATWYYKADNRLYCLDYGFSDVFPTWLFNAIWLIWVVCFFAELEVITYSFVWRAVLISNSRFVQLFEKVVVLVPLLIISCALGYFDYNNNCPLENFDLNTLEKMVFVLPAIVAGFHFIIIGICALFIHIRLLIPLFKQKSRCGRNEVYNECSSACEPKCQKEEIVCPPVCGPPKCECAHRERIASSIIFVHRVSTFISSIIFLIGQYKMLTATVIERTHILAGMALNTLLLYVIRRFTRASLGSYKHLLTIFVSFDFLLVIIHGIVRPKVVLAGRTFGTITDTFVESREVTAFYAAMFTLPFALLNIHFLYRYWTVLNNGRIALFSNPSFILLLILSSFTGVLIWFCLCIFGCTGEDLQDVGTEAVRTAYEHEYGKRIMDGWLVMDHSIGYQSPRTLLSLIAFDTIIILSFTFALSLGTLTYLEIRAAKKMSSQTRSLQLKLLIAVTAQTLVPLTFVYIPYFFVLNLPYFGIPAAFLGDQSMLMTACFPVWDAVIIMSLMTDYREAVLKMTPIARWMNEKVKTVIEPSFTTRVDDANKLHRKGIIASSSSLIMQFLLFALLPAMAAAITDYPTCDGDATKLCFETGDCSTSGFTGTVACNSAANTPVPAGGATAGCCEGGSADGTTTTTAATTVASATTTLASTSCVDLLNPLTGVSDCPARASLCTNTVYLDVMRVQCPRTCGFCTSSGTSANSTSTTTCVDRVNPNTNISDCPNMRIYCNNTIYKPLMTIQCPATCGFCTSG